MNPSIVLAVTPEQFQSSQSIAPTMNATYSPEDFEKYIKARQSEFGKGLERINQAARSGSARLTDEMVANANQFASAYASNVSKQFPIESAQPLPGQGRSTSLKMATEKKMREE